jgi:hypothetical protein
LPVLYLGAFKLFFELCIVPIMWLLDALSPMEFVGVVFWLPN